MGKVTKDEETELIFTVIPAEDPPTGNFALEELVVTAKVVD